MQPTSCFMLQCHMPHAACCWQRCPFVRLPFTLLCNLFLQWLLYLLLLLLLLLLCIAYTCAIMLRLRSMWHSFCCCRFRQNVLLYPVSCCCCCCCCCSCCFYCFVCRHRHRLFLLPVNIRFLVFNIHLKLSCPLLALGFSCLLAPASWAVACFWWGAGGSKGPFPAQRLCWLQRSSCGPNAAYCLLNWMTEWQRDKRTNNYWLQLKGKKEYRG